MIVCGYNGTEAQGMSCNHSIVITYRVAGSKQRGLQPGVIICGCSIPGRHRIQSLTEFTNQSIVLSRVTRSSSSNSGHAHIKSSSALGKVVKEARFLEREGLLERDVEHGYLASDAMEVGSMDQLRGHSITYRIAVGSQQARSQVKRTPPKQACLPRVIYVR